MGAKWDEIDLAGKMWKVPPGRMKAGKEHRVALSQRALELLRKLPTEKSNEFVFIGSRPDTGLSAASLTQTLRRMGCGDISVHGFRGTFRDWAAEQTNFPHEVAELALAHRVGSKTERAYLRADLLRKRFALAEAWTKYCDTPPTAGDGTVVPIRKRAAP